MRRLVAGAIGLGCFLSSAAVARNGVPRWDRAVFDRVNGLPGHLAPLLWAPMQAGALAAPLTVGAVYAIAGSRPRRGFQIAATGTAAWLTAKAVKRRIRRGRPGDHTGGATLRLGSADEGLGFPSGHAAVAVTLGVSLAAGQGTAAAAAATAAVVVVGVSRVYVGAHYPLDVAGGWALGLVVAAAARRSS